MTMVLQVPVAKNLLDWVCSADPEIYFNTCDVLYGSYEVSRPRALGGNIKKGKRHFEKVIKESPMNVFARVAFMQYYAILLDDEVVYKEQKKHLKRSFEKFQKFLEWSPKYSSDNEIFKEFRNEKMRLFQAVAFKRYEILKLNEKELFE